MTRRAVLRNEQDTCRTYKEIIQNVISILLQHSRIGRDGTKSARLLCKTRRNTGSHEAAASEQHECLYEVHGILAHPKVSPDLPNR